MRNADRIAGAALLALAVAFSAGALKYYTYWAPGGPGSGFVPFWLGVVMAVLAALMLLGTRRGRDATAIDTADDMPPGTGFKRVLVVVAATTAFVALLNVVGMILGTAAFLVVLMRLLDRNPWPLTLAVAAAAAGFNYLVFTLWLRVPFPVSPFGF